MAFVVTRCRPEEDVGSWKPRTGIKRLNDCQPQRNSSTERQCSIAGHGIALSTAAGNFQDATTRSMQGAHMRQFSECCSCCCDAGKIYASKFETLCMQTITATYDPLPPRPAITPRMICGVATAAVASDGTVVDTCSGDSGGPLLVPGATPALDVVYGYTNWGITPPNSDVECGLPGDLSFFVNVAALSSFWAPYLQPPAAPAPAPPPLPAGR